MVKEAYQKILESSFLLEVSNGFGSGYATGFVVQKNMILSVEHFVVGKERDQVTYFYYVGDPLNHESNKYSMKLISTNSDLDLALFKIAENQVPLKKSDMILEYIMINYFTIHSL